jgi:tetratricopeptide (TPR) repeat protein
MRSSHQWKLALGLVLLGVAAGCRSLPSPPPLEVGGLVSSPTLSPEQEQMAKAHAFYSTGIHHELLEEYPEAYEAYRQAGELDPGNERLILRLASTLVLQRKTEEALRAVEVFVEENPDSEAALLWLATFYGTTGNSERVVQLFEQLTHRFPQRPIGWLQLAAAVGHDGHSEASIHVLTTGLSKATPPTDLLQELVRIHLARMQLAETPNEQQAERSEAIRFLQQVAEEEPGDLDTLYTLGDLLVAEGRLSEAILVYQKTERLQPEDLKAKQRLASTYLAMGQPEQAIAVLEDLARDNPDAGTAHYYLGEVYLKTGNFPKAEEQFQRAADKSLADPDPWLKLAAVQAESDDQQAVATLKKGLAHMPENPKLLEVLALVRLSQKRYKQAATLMQEVYETLTAEDPDAIPSNLFFYNYALICTHRRQTQEGADWLLKAMEQESALLELYVQRALTGTVTFRTAATRVLQALSKRPNGESASVQAHLGTLYLAKERPGKAVRAFESALKLTRTEPLQSTILSPRFYFWYGIALDQAGQSDRAVEQFETCIQLDPTYTDALNYLAYLWATQGVRLEEAAQYIQSALALDPGNAAYMDTWGWVLYQQGAFSEAMELLLEADQLRPGDPEILEHIEKARKALAPAAPQK